ncbi:hypothetical protein PIB30_014252 [Stylosanthes scabra]|uniref:Uncharacterized protein n=1 Tax=Stylosanthes scabra TaxID=79078 RepID=A0ABU6Y8K6_9FABA|nr:hypothetical protein [Stylosanthes scabra]
MVGKMKMMRDSVVDGGADERLLGRNENVVAKKKVGYFSDGSDEDDRQKAPIVLSSPPDSGENRLFVKETTLNSVVHIGKLQQSQGKSRKEETSHLRKQPKRSRNSCMAIEVRSIALASKLPPRITFSSEEIKQTTDNRNKSLVISVVTIDTIIGSVFIDQRRLTNILFRRWFDALGLTEKDLEAHSDDLVRCSGKRLTPDSFVTLWFSIRNSPDTRNMKGRELVVSHNSAYNEILGRSTTYKVGIIMSTSILTRKFITDDREDEALRDDKSKAERCHITIMHDSKD